MIADQQAALSASKPKLPLWAPQGVKSSHWPSLPAQHQRIQHLTQQVAELQQQNAELQQQSQQVAGSDAMEAGEQVDELKVRNAVMTLTSSLSTLIEQVLFLMHCLWV